jgi:hypothetical protein
MDLIVPGLQPRGAESTGLIRNVLMAIMEDEDSIPTWSSGANAYYDRLAKLVETRDLALATTIQSAATMVRERYRTHLEHELLLHEVPLHKKQDPEVTEALEDDCCVCLRPLKSFKKLARLRPRAEGSATCGHFLHAECMQKLKPGATGSVSCPMCRADLGRRPLLMWFDLERAKPQF